MRITSFGKSTSTSAGTTWGENLSPQSSYYWPSMIADAKELVRKCEKCQKCAPFIHRPSRDLQPILNPLPFGQWGLDILGPFPEAPYQKKWLIVGINYFSKWIEAEAASNITEQKVRKFIWQNIISRFGVPKVFVFDHGRQFDNLPLKRYTNSSALSWLIRRYVICKAMV